MGKLVSAVIPCYNVEQYMGECLDSLIGQSIGLDNLEIILVDDASTDGTVNIIKEYEKRYPDNIVLILCEKNGRQGTAANIGMQYATGKYLSLLGADDCFHPDMYKYLVDIAQKNDCDIVQFRYKYVHDMSEAHPEEVTEAPYKLYNYGERRREYLLDSSILNESDSTKLYRKSLIDRTGVRLAEGVSYEEPLFTYPLKFYVDKVAVTETQLYYYRYNYNGTMLSRTNKLSTMTEHLQVQQEVYQWMQKTEFMEEYKNEIDLYFIHSFFAETFNFMVARGMPMPAVMLRYMAETLVKYVPDYRNNPYLGDSSLAVEVESLNLIDKLNLTDEELEAEAAAYMKKLYDYTKSGIWG